MKKKTTIKQILDDIYDDFTMPCFTWRQGHAIGLALCTLEDYFSKTNEYELSGYCNYLVRLRGGEKTVEEGKKYKDMKKSTLSCESVLIGLQNEWDERDAHKGTDGAALITMQVIEDRWNHIGGKQ